MFLRALALSTLLAFASITAIPASADEMQEFRTGDIVVHIPWVRAIVPNRPAAGYLMIHNNGTADDRLIGVSTPAAERAELHSHSMNDGVMQMRPIEAVDVPAGGKARLTPGADHIMLFGFTADTEAGTVVPLMLTFENAGMLHVDAVVAREQPEGPMAGQMGGDGDGGHSGHDDHGSGHSE